MLTVNVAVGAHQGQDHPCASRVADSRAPTRGQTTLHRGREQTAKGQETGNVLHGSSTGLLLGSLRCRHLPKPTQSYQGPDS